MMASNSNKDPARISTPDAKEMSDPKHHQQSFTYGEDFEKKSEINLVHVNSVDSNASVETHAHAAEGGRKWETRWLRWGPISGILCVLMAGCSMLASLAILVASHNAPTADWLYEPSTYRMFRLTEC